MLLEQLHEGVAVARLQEHADLAALAGFGDQIFRKVRTGEDAVHKITFDLFHAREAAGREIVEELARAPAEDAVNGAVLEKLDGLFFYSLHLKSSNLRFSPSFVMVATKSFIVAANFAPSAAETHSTLVRSRSMPRKSSIENSSVMRRRA